MNATIIGKKILNKNSKAVENIHKIQMIKSVKDLHKINTQRNQKAQNYKNTIKNIQIILGVINFKGIKKVQYNFRVYKFHLDWFNWFRAIHILKCKIIEINLSFLKVNKITQSNLKEKWRKGLDNAVNVLEKLSAYRLINDFLILFCNIKIGVIYDKSSNIWNILLVRSSKYNSKKRQKNLSKDFKTWIDAEDLIKREIILTDIIQFKDYWFDFINCWCTKSKSRNKATSKVLFKTWLEAKNPVKNWVFHINLIRYILNVIFSTNINECLIILTFLVKIFNEWKNFLNINTRRKPAIKQTGFLTTQTGFLKIHYRKRNIFATLCNLKGSFLGMTTTGLLKNSRGRKRNLIGNIKKTALNTVQKVFRSKLTNLIVVQKGVTFRKKRKTFYGRVLKRIIKPKHIKILQIIKPAIREHNGLRPAKMRRR